MSRPSASAHAPSPVSPLPFDGHPPSPGRSRADAIERFEGDPVFFERIVPLFRQATLDQSAALEAALARGDLDQVRHWAHTLKGSLLTVGADPSAEQAARIELAVREGRAHELPGLVGRLMAEVAVIVANLAPDAR